MLAILYSHLFLHISEPLSIYKWYRCPVKEKYINTDCVSYLYCGVNGGKRMMYDCKTQPYNLMVNQLYYSTKSERDLPGIKNKSDMLDI